MAKLEELQKQRGKAKTTAETPKATSTPTETKPQEDKLKKLFAVPKNQGRAAAISTAAKAKILNILGDARAAPTNGGCYRCGGSHFMRDCKFKPEDMHKEAKAKSEKAIDTTQPNPLGDRVTKSFGFITLNVSWKTGKRPVRFSVLPSASKYLLLEGTWMEENGIVISMPSKRWWHIDFDQDQFPFEHPPSAADMAAAILGKFKKELNIEKESKMNLEDLTKHMLSKCKLQGKEYERLCKLIKKQDTVKYVAKCDRCQRCKPIQKKPKGLFQLFSAQIGRFERIGQDLMGPKPMTTNRNKFILVIVDYATGWVEVVSLRNAKILTLVSHIMRFFQTCGVTTQGLG
uniref:Integrase catalytic domain-containing protein n=1 Tax=Strigamia maritima TaxID=126957 RepID=T1IRB4_STRMM